MSSTRFRVLDVGCGNNPRGDVNVDLSIGHTLQGGDQRKGIYIDPKRIPNFIQADAHHLPFKDGSFQKVISHHVIEHVNDPFKVICEMLRVSNDEIEIVCPHKHGAGAKMPFHKHFFDERWFEKVFKLLGIRAEVIVRRTIEDYVHEMFVTWLLMKLRIRKRFSIGGYHPIYLALRKVFGHRLAKMLSFHFKWLERPYEIIARAWK